MSQDSDVRIHLAQSADSYRNQNRPPHVSITAYWRLIETLRPAVDNEIILFNFDRNFVQQANFASGQL
jgi:hypothetical protein